MTRIHTNKTNKPKLCDSLRITRINTNKNNKMHLILSEWKCFPGHIRYFVDFFRIHSCGSWFDALFRFIGVHSSHSRF